jgi:HAMP domain-containing protein
MNTGNVNNLMNQQLKALKDIEDLLAHDAKQDVAHNVAHSIKQENIDALKAYVETMKLACTTAIALAKHYEPKGTPAKSAALVQPTHADVYPEDVEEENEAPPAAPASEKKKEAAKKPEPVKEEPPIDDDLDFLN